MTATHAPRPGCPRPANRLCVGLLALLLARGATAQDPPTGDILTFTLTITGGGSDPDRTGTAAKAGQYWSFRRVITGWVEVQTRRKKTGRGTNASERIEYRFDRKSRHNIVGQRRDQVYNKLRELGEGGTFADYQASETWTADCDLHPQDSVQLTLDAATQSWDLQFMPFGWLADLQNNSRYEGAASFKPGPGGGFGEPWTRFTDDASLRTDGPHPIQVRYHAGANFENPVPMAALQSRWPAQFDGKVARGHVETDVPRFRAASGDFKMRYLLDWAVAAELTDVELEVRAADYDRWEPTAGLGEREAGPALYLVSELRARDPARKARLPKIAQLSWRLVGTSREPGIAVNYPYGSRDRRCDLELVAGDLTPARDDDNQELVLRPDGPRSEVAVFPYDWGGSATLKVVATLEDGREIDGFLRGAPGVAGPVTDIPIPASPPGSRIAASWLRRHCPEWKSDQEDLDAWPTGKPGVDGDGFSVYEEYRGLVWNQRHLRTDPQRKDLFIRRSSMALEARAGIEQFTRASQLQVHVTTREDELPGADGRRVVNVNTRYASNGPQTGLWIQFSEGSARPNDAIPPGARPATVPVIAVPSPTALTASSSAFAGLETNELDDALAHMVMQALFQACGVDRPGPSDPVRLLVFVPADKARGVEPHYLLDGVRVRVESERGLDLAVKRQQLRDLAGTDGDAAPLPTVGYPVVVGLPGGAHSGPEECILRDWFAQYYPSRYVRDGIPIYRIAEDQKPGTVLGRTRAGTGINQKDRTPEPSFGDSSVSEPAARQLVVRDNAR